MPPWAILFGIFVAVLSGGCSSGPTSTSSFSLVNAQGSHPANFLSTHQVFVGSAASECRECHGDDLRGGIANISCFTASCHHGTVPGWASSGSHGAAAKRAPGNGGFVSCQICHASDFTGDGSLVSCLNNAACHGAGVQSPHPQQPWRASSGPTHTDTVPANAPVCAVCHFPGSANNPANHPATPAPPGTAPGCFNNTLCHGQSAAPHALGPDWLDPAVGGASFHGLTAKQDLAYCQSCHGTPGSIQFNGGAASTSCSTSGCHAAAKAHPVPWYQAPQSFPGYVASHRNSGNRAVACALCHDVTQGRTAPDPAAPSCFSATHNGINCHVNGPGNPNHNVPFQGTTHTSVGSTGFDTNCANCHAETGSSPLAAAPLCTVCHQAGSPLTLANCTSCHAKPPAGSAYPDIANSHSTHDALAGVTNTCTACHTGIESGTLAHYNRANARPGMDALRTPPGDAAISSTYNAKGGSASFSSAAFTCANTSCHGGITTPRWDTGTISSNTNAGCLACHTLGTALGTPQNNSPYSGLHSFHLGTTVNALCTECHDMANGSAGATNHFASLNTPQMEGPANLTVTFPGLSGATYDSGAQTCALTCHTHSHTASPWSGGADHSVPFLETAHTNVSGPFSSTTCDACHFETGATDKLGPTCTVCHQAGSPLTLASCTSCHAKPPAGSTYPDIAGRHDTHNLLTGVANVCTTCHNGLDTGTQAHYDRANARPGMNALRVAPGDAAFLSAYNAKAGAASFNSTALTCANVSCHGGLLAPNWRTGTINSGVDAGCRQCHALGTALGTPENNSPYSGLHSFHLGTTVSALCTECHDMANGSSGALNHFTSLTTPQMEGPANQTVTFPGLSGATYDAGLQTCALTCHGHLHSASSWEGGANHSVPFLDASHTNVSSGTFSSTCGACHNETGSTDKFGPTCTVCHQAGSPLTLASCTSCHADPPSGTAYPDIARKHAKHNALAGVTNVCAACHNGLDSGTQAHYDRANARPGLDALRVAPGDVSFAAVYDDKPAGGPTFSSTGLTCSKVSCHGGQTINWDTGSINVNTDAGCAQCHRRSSDSDQWNSQFSGEHNKHRPYGCTECHDMTLATPGAQNHFAYLGTTTMEGPASDTFRNSTGSVVYTPATGRCSGSCHSKNHNNENW
ncbi:MAG: hypothetical protein OEM47_02235 [Deltaproteobacteria bacterium]|nr:hypothetical protein [Deltaproteobacteria bacterium]